MMLGPWRAGFAKPMIVHCHSVDFLCGQQSRGIVAANLAWRGEGW